MLSGIRTWKHFFYVQQGVANTAMSLRETSLFVVFEKHETRGRGCLSMPPTGSGGPRRFVPSDTGGCLSQARGKAGVGLPALVAGAVCGERQGTQTGRCPRTPGEGSEDAAVQTTARPRELRNPCSAHTERSSCGTGILMPCSLGNNLIVFFFFFSSLQAASIRSNKRGAIISIILPQQFFLWLSFSNY